MEHNWLHDAFIYLSAAVISVPIAKRLGLGSVLGYLGAGMIIGPPLLHLVEDQTNVMHFAEFGVVMMLFLVGLELNPSLLWRLRTPIVGTGGLQVALTTAALFGIGLAIGLEWRTALAIGLILSLSSTAIVLQSLQEKGLMKTTSGEAGFAVLLFQDIAVIPILAVMPLLALNTDHVVADTSSGWVSALWILLVVGSIIIGGYYLIRPVLSWIARFGSREIFVASALLLVVGISLAMDKVGLSPALGTFLAGVVLAESEYRHELISDIEPFKGLLLGLFFISVGAGIDFSLFFQNPLLILGLVSLLIGAKFIVLMLVGRLFGMPSNHRWQFACFLAQGGEFAFVLTSFALQEHVFNSQIGAYITLVVALSMVATPLLILLHDKWIQPRFMQKQIDKEADHINEHNPVIIAGFGRFGQLVGRLLHGHGIGTTVLETDASQIEMLRKYNYKVYFGDAARADLLHAAGAEHASTLIVAVDDPSKSLEIAQSAQKHYPHLTIMVRAIDRPHAFELLRSGIDFPVRETMGSAVEMGIAALQSLGFRANQAHRAGQIFRRHDERILREQVHMEQSESNYISQSLQYREVLAKLLNADERESNELVAEAWESESPLPVKETSSKELGSAHKQNKNKG